MKLDELELQEIADAMTLVENDELDDIITAEAIYEKYDVDYDSFSKIVNDIFRMIDFGLSSLTVNAYVGISTEGLFHAKKDVTKSFIPAIISFISEGEGLSPESKGWEKVVNVNGEPKYKLIVTHYENE